MRLTQVPLVPQFSQNSPVLMETNPLNSIILLTPLISVEHMGKLNSPVLTESSNLITGKRHIFLVGGLEQFGTYFIFPYVGNHNLNWLIIFRGVETTNRIPNAKRDFFPHVWAILLQVYGYSHVSRDQASAVPWTRKSVNGLALLGTSHPETMFPPPNWKILGYWYDISFEIVVSCERSDQSRCKFALKKMCFFMGKHSEFSGEQVEI